MKVGGAVFMPGNTEAARIPPPEYPGRFLLKKRIRMKRNSVWLYYKKQLLRIPRKDVTKALNLPGITVGTGTRAASCHAAAARNASALL